MFSEVIARYDWMLAIIFTQLVVLFLLWLNKRSRKATPDLSPGADRPTVPVPSGTVVGHQPLHMATCASCRYCREGYYAHYDGAGTILSGECHFDISKPRLVDARALRVCHDWRMPIVK